MLLQHNVQTEAYGGDVPAVLVSAKTKQGLDELLETILLVADMKELPDGAWPLRGARTRPCGRRSSNGMH